MDTETQPWTIVREPADATEPTEPAVPTEATRETPPDEPAPTQVVVRRRGLLFLVLAAAYAVMAALFLTRAITDGATLDSVLAAVLVVGTLGLWVLFFDSREDLLVADDRGVRLRLGGTWRGMFWVDLEKAAVLPRHGLHDGRLLLEPIEPEVQEGLLGRAERVHARINTALYGAPFALPLTLTTRVLGAGPDLAQTLTELADERCPVVRIDPYQAWTDEDEVDQDEVGEDELDEVDVEADQDDASDELADAPADEVADALTDESGPEVDRAARETTPADAVSPIPSPTPWPARVPRLAVRADVDQERPALAAADDPEQTQPFALVAQTDEAHDTHDASGTPDIADTGVWRASTVVIDDLADVPVVDPVIGPVLATARRMLHLDVDQLSQRTRIRPHVIEAIEIDDFGPCGGDFYARGHVRTLARVLGVDVAPLLEIYDERYADAPIDPVRVFEAELAGAGRGPIRSTRGGPNWTVLVAAVMTVVLAWSVARLVMDDPGPATRSPGLADGSAGLTSARTKAAPVPVTLTAAGGGAHLVVRDGSGTVVFTGDLAFGQSKTLQVPPPVRIQSSDGSTRVSVQGHDEGALGRTGRPAEHVYPAP